MARREPDGDTGVEVAIDRVRSLDRRLADLEAWVAGKLPHTHAMDGVSSRAARVYLAANQSISNSTFTKVAFDTVDSDAHGLFDSANNEIVVDRAGWWVVSLSLRYEANATGDRRYARIMVNGSTVAQTVLGPSGSVFVLSTSDVVKVASGDKIAGEAWQDSGGSLNVQSGSNTTWLTAAFMGS